MIGGESIEKMIRRQRINKDVDISGTRISGEAHKAKWPN